MSAIADGHTHRLVVLPTSMWKTDTAVDVVRQLREKGLERPRALRLPNLQLKVESRISVPPRAVYGETVEHRGAFPEGPWRLIVRSGSWLESRRLQSQL